MGLQTIHDKVAEKLGPAVPSSLGARGVNDLTTFPRYVWLEDDGATYDGPGTTGGTTKILHDRVQPVDVHIWGADRAQCELLEGALISALRQAVLGKNYSPKGARWLPSSDVTSGEVLVVRVTIQVPVPEIQLPLTLPAEQAPAGDTNTSVEVTPAVTEVLTLDPVGS